MSRRDAEPLRAVSLFSNCGAGDIGFAQAGFQFDVMAELDPRRLEVALLNHPTATGVPGDLRTTLAEVVEVYRRKRGDEKPALLAACPPCQGMSSARSSRGRERDPDVGSVDHRNLLVEVIANGVLELSPRILVVENVQAFLTRQVRHPCTGEPVSAASYLISAIADSYAVYPLLADLADFGIPQSRKRCFLTFIHKDEAGLSCFRGLQRAPYPRASHGVGSAMPVNLADALASFALPPLDACSAERSVSSIPMHFVPVWQDRRYDIINAIPPNSGLSAWENDRCLECGEESEDRGTAVCRCGAVLPRPIVRDTNGTIRLVTGFHSSYRRMSPRLPAATITTASGHVGSDRTVHPSENRVLSPLECSLLQTIPVSFKWGDAMAKWGHTNVRAMIGEAVPPLFTRKHGRILASLLRDIPPRMAMSTTDNRIRAADAALSRGQHPSQ